MVVLTSAKLATARSDVKMAKEMRLGTIQTTVDMKADTSVIVVTVIALTARR